MSSSIVTNLYFRFEIQQASISVSTLKCDPYDDSVTLDELDSRLKELNVSKVKLRRGHVKILRHLSLSLSAEF